MSIPRRLRPVLVVLLLAVLAAATMLAVGLPDVPDASTATLAQEEPTATEAATDAAATETDAAMPGVTYQIFLNRDPFAPVVPVLDAPDATATAAVPGVDPAASPTPGASPTPSASPTPGTSPTPSPSGTPGSSPAPVDGCRQGEEVTCQGREVVLVDIYEAGGQDVVRVSVDGTLHDVTEGQTFAGSFRVLDVAPPCATFLFGDDAFTLCEGEGTLK